jgi:DNA-binding CsgD family transcriptional regulator
MRVMASHVITRQLVLPAEPPAARSSAPGALVARERELAALRDALDASAVDGRSIVIGGDAGSGKSALLAAFLSEARRAGVVVVEGACVEIESRRPFGAFAEVIASSERSYGSERVERALMERGVNLRQLTTPGVAVAGGPGRDRYQMHGAILGLLGDLTTDGPLVISLEDLHWADEASLELFGYLTRRLHARPVLIVATYRTDELDRRHPLRPALAELRRSRLIDELSVPALDLEGSGQLIRARLVLRDQAAHDLREFRDLVHARCEGNPLYIEETLDTLRRSGHLSFAKDAWTCDIGAIEVAIPASVADGVVSRWAGLSPLTQQVLLVAAVAGHHFDLELVSSVSGIAVAALAPLIHEAIDARLIREESNSQTLSFHHALTREALRQQLLQGERRALHAKIAAFLERRRERMPVRAAELAYHIDESGDVVRAGPYHEAAAHEAAAATDYAGASRSLERAIAAAADPDAAQGLRQLALFRYLTLSGDDPRASRAAAAALEIGERIGDARVQGEALIDLYNSKNRNSDDVQAEDLLDRARALLEPVSPTPVLVSVYAAVSGAAARRGDFDRAVAFAEHVRRTATVVGLPAPLALAAMSFGNALYMKGRWTESIAAYREAVDIAERGGLVQELYGALVGLGVLLATSGASLDEQREVALRRRAVARAHGLSNQVWIVRELGFLHGEGEWDSFLKLLPQVAEPDRREGDIVRLLAVFISVARTGPGEVSQLDDARARVASHGHSGASAFWSAALLLLAGRPREAVQFAATVRDEEVSRRYWGLGAASLAHAIGLFAARECDDAVAREHFLASLLVDRPLPSAPHSNRRHIALANADVAEHTGRTDAALAAYAAVVAECERAPYGDHSAIYLSSLIRQRRADLYLRASPADVVSAQAELDAVLPYWQKAKATWYLGQLRAWAQQCGLAFPAENKAPETAVASRQLTRRELEVARLVAQGMTNREIGTRLTLSVRTAESHVEQIRAKLGFRTRAQIAAWVTERFGTARS